MPDPIPPPNPAPASSSKWWITTAIGVLSGLATAVITLSQHCPFGPEVCTGVAAAAAIAAALLGITHSGNIHLTPNS